MQTREFSVCLPRRSLGEGRFVNDPPAAAAFLAGMVGCSGVGEKELAVEYIRPGEIYREPGVDLQLPTSHLAFRLPAGFAGRLAANETFKIFSVDRELSCFVFIHGPDAPLLANWMRAEFTIDGEKLVAAGSGQALLTREFPFARPLPVRA